MEKIEYKLIESESECARLSDIVLTEIPQLKEELAVRNHLYVYSIPLLRLIFLLFYFLTSSFCHYRTQTPRSLR